MTKKEFISPEVLFRDSFTLAKIIYDSGYRPDFMLVLWRGGAPIGMVVHEFLLYRGINVHHMVIKAESYTGMECKNEPLIGNIDNVLSVLKQNSKVLLVDDIYDTGSTIKKIKQLLVAKTQNIKTATLYLKNGAALPPDFFLRKVSNWIVFPHEIANLSLEEIRNKDEYIHSLLI